MDVLAPFRLLGGLLWPRVCAHCGEWLVRGEEDICLHCIDKLPVTGYMLFKGNPVERIFHGRIPLRFASSYLHFSEHGMVQKLMHQIKYTGNKDLAKTLGKLFAAELMLHHPDFKPDIIVPVPLHPKKERQRGYNQSWWFAGGIGEITGATVSSSLLIRTRYAGSQTRKNRIQRWDNVGQAFELLSYSGLEGKSIILVDDVITTGATAEACLNEICKIPGVSLGYLSLAVATG